MIQRLTGEYFEQIYELLEKSFPLDEYRTQEEQKKLFDREEYRVYGLVNEGDGRLQAILAAWELEQFTFIEHFAVDPAERSRGIGERVLQEVLKQLSGPVCLEVELPENRLAERRIEFYARNGFFLNAYPYLQPPICKGRQTIPLRIMTRGRVISEEEFNKIKEELYQKVYGI